MALHGDGADEGGGWDAGRVRRATAGFTGLIAGLMLVTWFAGFEDVFQSDKLAPLSPLSCIGFITGAAGLWLLPRPAGKLLGALAAAVGLAGMVDVITAEGRAINLLLGADARISAVTATELMLLGAAIALDGRGRPSTRRLAIVGGAIAGAAGIGYLLGVPLFYGSSRLVHMSWQAAVCALALAIGIGALNPTGPLFDPGLSGRFARSTLPGAISIPVIAGALSTAAARGGLWPFSVAAWVMTLAAVAGVGAVVAMAVHRLAEDDRQLTELAIRDPLTGAYNRRHFVTEAQRAATRSRRYREGGAIAVVDLDHFKEVNDSYGHAAGDAVLSEFARRLRIGMREVDLAFRQGGEEFVVLLPETDAYGSAIVAERLGAAIRDIPVPIEARRMDAVTGLVVDRIRISVSIGIAVYPEHGITAQQVLDAADDALYVAKNSGRDTYRLAEVVSQVVPDGQFDQAAAVPGGPQPPRQSRGR